MRITRWAVATAVGLVAGALAFGSPVSAADNEVLVTVDGSDCGISITSSWATDKHLVANAVVVVYVAGTVHSAPVGTPIELTDLPEGTADAQWRVWGGGERDYDSPALTDLDALLDHLAVGGDVLDADAPGVAWHDLPVVGCKPAPTPTATADPQPTPTVEPTEEPTADPSIGPGVSDDEDLDPVAADGLPVTGSKLPVAIGIAGFLAVAAGFVLRQLSRRRRISFTA